MAFAATVQWDVRTTGNDANGGGFDSTSGTPGTDYSQQDSPQITYTDLVIGGTTTQITSVLNPFTSAHVGNIINITSGTGFTVQRIQIMSVATAVATCDKSVGTGASTGGNGKLGGAFITIGAANTLAVAGNIIHIKAGTYTLTTVLTLSVNLMLIGYNSTHNDGGTKPLITTATNSTVLFQTTTSTFYFRNLSLSNTASVRAIGMNAYNSYNSCTVEKCVFDGFTNCIGSTNSAWGRLSIFGSEFKNWTGTAVDGSAYPSSIFGCYFHDGVTGINNAVDGFWVARCVFNTLTGSAVTMVNALFSGMYIENTFYACARGLDTAGSISNQDIHNNIFYGCSGSGIRQSSGVLQGPQWNNAFGGNGANRSGTTYVGPAPNDIALSVDPFTNAAGGDFSLNSTAGGGAACKAAGFQWGA